MALQKGTLGGGGKSCIRDSLSKIDMRLMMLLEMCGVGRCMLLVVVATTASIYLNFNHDKNLTRVLLFYLSVKEKTNRLAAFRER